MERCLCIHGHFYQPPRENPWLEAVEFQESASPWHDWNERITAECYAPNAASKILDASGRTVKTVNNYSKISFNFGPTLLSWLEENSPKVYRTILNADRESEKQFSGHGSALAQVYNHMILPLANRRDKYTQVFWGIRDFEYRFGRKPEGMWLPETAVDVETLEILAELGIRFTLLAPHQAVRVKERSSREWRALSKVDIDSSMPYALHLPSGRSLSVFFYDEPISNAIAFQGILSSGEQFAHKLLSAFSGSQKHAQLVHVATDGETYGHHHRFGDMALAYALHHIETHKLARLTNYGEFLEKYPPSHEVEIADNTSWSCPHGIERWRSDCGCKTGAHPEWNQKWRGALRDALDELRDAVTEPYEEKAGRFLKDPWAARNEYITVILDRSDQNIHSFFNRQAAGALDDSEKPEVLKLMELQRNAMLMHTSCGWFFDDISGIEGVQILRYAGRVLELAKDLFGKDLEERFLESLGRAKSNIAEQGDGRHVFRRLVKPDETGFVRVAAHYALSSFFKPHADSEKMYRYSLTRLAEQTFSNAKWKFIVGMVRVSSDITLDAGLFTYAALWSGGEHLDARIREKASESDFQKLLAEAQGKALPKTGASELASFMERYVGGERFTIFSMLKDTRRKILEEIHESAL